MKVKDQYCDDCEYQLGGGCFRLPPILLIDSDDGEFFQGHPNVAKDDWCGEWKEREDD